MAVRGRGRRGARLAPHTGSHRGQRGAGARICVASRVTRMVAPTAPPPGRGRAPAPAGRGPARGPSPARAGAGRVGRSGRLGSGPQGVVYPTVPDLYPALGRPGHFRVVGHHHHRPPARLIRRKRAMTLAVSSLCNSPWARRPGSGGGGWPGPGRWPPAGAARRRGWRGEAQAAPRPTDLQERARGRSARPPGPQAASMGRATFSMALTPGRRWKRWKTKPRVSRRRRVPGAVAEAVQGLPSRRTVPCGGAVEQAR